MTADTTRAFGRCSSQRSLATSPLLGSAARRPIRCRRGTTARPRRRSSSSCRRRRPQGRRQFVPPAERIATFDQDGTLWVEQPMYSQVIVLPRPRAGRGQGEPELANVEPFKTVMSGDREAIAQAADAGSREDPRRDADRHDGRRVRLKSRSGSTRRDPRWKRRLHRADLPADAGGAAYCRANGYKTYIVTGGGQDFVRVYAEQVYGIPPSRSSAPPAHELRLRQGRQAVPDQGAEAPAERQQGRQARGHPPDDRPPARRGVRQLDRRPRDARIHRGRRRRAAGDAGAARRRHARIRLRPGARLPDTKVGTFTQALYDEATRTAGP